MSKNKHNPCECACKRSAQTSQGVRNLDGPQVNARRMPDENRCTHDFSRYVREEYDTEKDVDSGYFLCERCGYKDRIRGTISLPF